jgi:hypothetical protein
MNYVPVALILLSITCHAGERWKEFAPKEGKFRVLMPGTPEASEVKFESEFGPATFHMNTVEEGESFYGAHYSDYTEAIKKLPVKRVYDASRDGAAENMKGKVVGEGDVKLGAHAGREIRIEVDGRSLFRARVFLVGTRLYQVVYFGPKGAATSKEVDRYLDSFKLTE